MGAGKPEKETRGLSKSRRHVAAMVVVASLILLPSTALFFTAQHPGTSPAGGDSSRISAFWDKPVHFIEMGLAHGMSWSVDLNGTTGSSTTTEINFTWIKGVFPFSVLPVPGYTANPSSGDVTVLDTGATVYITFTPIQASYSVTFKESGLAPGTVWWVNLTGMNTSAAVSTIKFSVVNGSYPFTTPPLLPGTAAERFNTSLTSGMVVVKGTDLTINVPYFTQFFLTMGVTPTGAGTVTPASGWVLNGSVVSLSETPASGYAFLGWKGSGNGNYTGMNTLPAVTMHGPIDEIASFGVAYAVDFEELGLHDGVTWSVTFNGITESALLVFLDFAAVNGTYPYTVAPIPGYHADKYHGMVTVAGSDVTEIIHWVRITYNVSFVESGLPSGTSWSVTLNGTTQTSTTFTILFLESNWSLPFTVAPVTGYTANVTGGTVVVNGADVKVAIGWTLSPPVARGYTVTFVETGLPVGSAWSVSLNGSGANPGTTQSTSLAFSGVSTGTYHYWVPDAGAYHATAPSGTVAVASANVTIPVVFAGLGPSVTHTSGLQISVEDLVIFALIGSAGIVAAYLIYRRE